MGTFAESGERLPIASRFSGHLSLGREFPLAGDRLGFGAVEVSRVGDRKGPFRAKEMATRPDYPAYTTVDLRAGVRTESWTCTLFVTNATDERGALNGGVGTGIPLGLVYITPRTYGVSVARSF
jgi:hypothetical protein